MRSTRAVFRRLLPAVACAAAVLAARRAPAQDSTVVHALRRIFASRDFAPERFGPARWLDGDAYTTLEPSAEVQGAMDIVRYRAATGSRDVLVSARRLVPPGAATALEVEDYAWSADGARLLVFTNSRKVCATTRAATTGCSTWAAAPCAGWAGPVRRSRR